MEEREDDRVKAEQNLTTRWDNITKIRVENKKYATFELTCIFQQVDSSSRDDMFFFENFLKDYIKVSKQVTKRVPIQKYTHTELLYLIQFHQLVFLRYGKEAAFYTFNVMRMRNPISFKKVYRQLLRLTRKRQYNRLDANQNSFDTTFKTQVLDKIPTRYKEDWEALIDSHMSKLKERASRVKKAKE